MSFDFQSGPGCNHCTNLPEAHARICPAAAARRPQVLQEFYEATLKALEKARNERLWFKTQLKLANLWFKKQEYGRMSKIIRELHKWVQQGETGGCFDVARALQRATDRVVRCSTYGVSSRSLSCDCVVLRSVPGAQPVRPWPHPFRPGPASARTAARTPRRAPSCWTSTRWRSRWPPSSATTSASRSCTSRWGTYQQVGAGAGPQRVGEVQGRSGWGRCRAGAGGRRGHWDQAGA